MYCLPGVRVNKRSTIDGFALTDVLLPDYSKKRLKERVSRYPDFTSVI
jgi:hypothetical protein